MDSLLDQNLSDIPEQTTVPEGEYEVQVFSADIKTNDKGSKWLSVGLNILNTGDPNVKDVYHSVFFPREDDDPKRVQGSLRRIKQFCEAFGLRTDRSIREFEANVKEEIIGQSAYALLVVKDDPKYGVGNEVKNFVVSH